MHVICPKCMMCLAFFHEFLENVDSDEEAKENMHCHYKVHWNDIATPWKLEKL